MLEVEIYNDKSPIWDPDFKRAPPPHVQQQTSADSSLPSKSSDSETSSRTGKRSSEDDAVGDAVSAAKRQKLSHAAAQYTAKHEDLDNVIAEIVGVIDEEAKMLGPQVNKQDYFSV